MSRSSDRAAPSSRRKEGLGCSWQDTASRDLTDLVAKKALKKGKACGRSTHFVLA